MKRVMQYAVVLAVILIVAGIYIHVRPRTYSARGLMWVESYNGTTCSYFPHDNWHQFPTLCGETSDMLATFKYR